jgi:hypothetical protein
MKHLSFLFACVVSTAAMAADDDSPKNINHYLSDITGGTVSAVGLIDAKGAAITTIESAQDLVLALTPLTSREGGKGAFGIAVTPARTTLLPMKGSTYLAPGAWYARLAANLTLSYAQTQADYGGLAYRKSAFAIDTSYIFDVTQDPVYRANEAFKTCARKPSEFAARAAAIARDPQLSKDERQAALLELADERGAALTACMDADIAAARKAPWNSARMSIGYGAGRIEAESGGPSYSLGKAFNLNAQHWLGIPNGLLQISLRHARDAIDLDTLGGTPSFESSRLAALRYTHGDDGESSLRVLAEVSTARSSSTGVYRQAFLYALGIDKRLARGTWLEFRLGRNRSRIDGQEQNTALLSLNLAPTLFEFKK